MNKIIIFLNNFNFLIFIEKKSKMFKKIKKNENEENFLIFQESIKISNNYKELFSKNSFEEKKIKIKEIGT